MPVKTLQFLGPTIGFNTELWEMVFSMTWMMLENLHVGTARQSLGFAAQHLAHLAAVAIRLARAADVYRRDARGSSGGTLSGLFRPAKKNFLKGI